MDEKASRFPDGDRLFERRSSAVAYLCAAAALWNGLGLFFVAGALDPGASQGLPGPTTTPGAIGAYSGFVLAFVGMATVCVMAWFRSDRTWSGELGLRTRMVVMGGVGDATRYLDLGRRFVVAYVTTPVVLIAGGITLLVLRRTLA